MPRKYGPERSPSRGRSSTGLTAAIPFSTTYTQLPAWLAWTALAGTTTMYHDRGNYQNFDMLPFLSIFD
jgi:hypothetical protein